MSGVLSGLKPEKVFSFFEEISRIPRGSGNEKEISDYLVNFAQKRGLEVIQDEALNVIIKKPGYKGYENATTVILQGHMDMVCEKEANVEHDFTKDPIKLKIEGDMIKASKTTLGADNGIAVAFCLAILDAEDIIHPPLEVLITTEEETGMGGASKLDAKNIKGKILINIDSEEEGILLVSCAGGLRSKVKLPIEWEKAKKDAVIYSLEIKGLKGGHSGSEIDKGRANANKLMGRILNDLMSEIEFNLSNINGGAKMNAIARTAEAHLVISSNNEAKLKNKIEIWDKVLKNEYKSSDPNMSLELKKLDTNLDKVFTYNTTQKVVDILIMIPNGINTMSMAIEGLVESSTNLGVVTTTNEQVTFDSALRSSVRSLKYEILRRIETVAKLVGASAITQSEYPEWEYKTDSYIREIFIEVYKTMFHKEPDIEAIHAGLECGLFNEKFGDVDMISFGPNMYDVHTPDECLSISSTQRTWKYLLEVLKEIKN